MDKLYCNKAYPLATKLQSLRAFENAKLSEQIGHCYGQSMRIYGRLRIYYDLKEMYIRYSKNRVARLMKALKLCSIQGYKRPRYRIGRQALVSPSELQRQFTYTAPDQAWVADITYICNYEG